MYLLLTWSVFTLIKFKNIPSYICIFIEAVKNERKAVMCLWTLQANKNNLQNLQVCVSQIAIVLLIVVSAHCLMVYHQKYYHCFYQITVVLLIAVTTYCLISSFIIFFYLSNFLFTFCLLGRHPLSTEGDRWMDFQMKCRIQKV